ncbi:MAG: 2-hydroxyacyl-CoA dehydratase [Dehalococcoidia bacterium]
MSTTESPHAEKKPGQNTGLMDGFRRIIQERHDYAREWKDRTGGRVFGGMCTYVPEEIIYAAGILPVRVLGSHEPQDVSERHIYAMFCPFCRDVLAQGLLGRYDYLEGLIMSHTCMHLRQSFDSWVTHVGIDYFYYLFMPQLIRHRKARGYLTTEFTRFKENLEGWIGKKISNEEIDRAIEVHNTNRRLLRQIYELRKSPNPPISGAECMELVVSSQLCDKAEHNGMLERLLKELPARQDLPPAGTRLMVIGGECDDQEAVRLVEASGANVVADDLCCGSRYFWNEVIPGEDRMSALAQGYLNKPPCPLKDVTHERIRFKYVLDMAREFNVQGVLQVMQKFCDPHEFDIPAMERFLKDNGIPSYSIELDVTMPVGQLQTRTEAFLEMLELEI